MSQENVEIGEPVRRLFAAFNKRDWGAFSAELGPEVEYGPGEEHAVYRGPEALIQYVERWLEAWDTFLMEAEEIESTPAEDRAFIAIRFRGRGKGSGAEFDQRQRSFWVGELRGGRLYRTPTRGIDAAMWNRNAWLDTWDEHSLDLDEVIEDGDDVVALVHITARGATSGVEADVRFYAQFKVRDGKIVYIYDHEDREAALQAAGLRE